jgi:hypothetical protein
MDTEKFCHLYRESEMKLQAKIIDIIFNNSTENKYLKKILLSKHINKNFFF